MEPSTLVALRTARDLTQVELAAKAKVSRATLANLERGANRNPRTQTLRRLANALGVDIAALLGSGPDARPARRIHGRRK